MSRGQEAPLLHDKQPGLQHNPYSRTAPGCSLDAVSEACICDSTFSQLLSAYWVMGGLVVPDVRQPSSPRPSLTAQERGPSPDQVTRAQERLKAAGHDPGSVDGVWGPQTEPPCATTKNNTASPFPASWMRPHAPPWASPRPRVSRCPAPGRCLMPWQEAQTPRTVPEERPEQRNRRMTAPTSFRPPRVCRPRKRCPISPTRGRSWALTSFVTPSTPAADADL